MKIILLVGLPGSGKTTYGRSLGVPFFDDLTQNGGVESLKFERDTIAISDFALIFESSRRLAEAILRRHAGEGVEIEYVVWENNPDACWQNIRRRDDGRVLHQGTLETLSRGYEYPKGVKLTFLPVYQPK
jgi:hypothetical protein